MRLIDHIPPDLLEVENVYKLAEVFTRLQEYKDIPMEKLYDLLMNNGLADNPIGNKIVEELMGLFNEVPNELPRRIIQSLRANASKIIKFRGTPEMTTLLLQSLSAGLVRNYYKSFYDATGTVTIKPNDFFLGRLMNEEDYTQHFLGNEINTKYIWSSELGSNSNGRDEDGNYHVLIVSPFAHIENYRTFVANTFLLHVRNMEGNTDKFNFYFYHYTFLNPFGGAWMYNLSFSDEPTINFGSQGLDSGLDSSLY